jgi:hypothetical protein
MPTARPSRLLVCLLLALSCALSASGTAGACSCGGGAAPVWPPDGATAVALDAPIVVAGSDLAVTETTLTADDGTEIELVEQGRLEMGPSDCVNHHYLFLAPRELLQPQRSYVLFAQGGDWNPLLSGLAPRPVSFVTGSALRDPSAPELNLHLYATAQPEGHELELFVEAQLTEPVFIGVTAQHRSYVRAVFPASVSGYAANQFALPFGVVDCATPTFVDVAGNTFASPRLCEPSKCSAPQTLVSSPCGGEPSSPLGWEDWQNLPDGCRAPTDVTAARSSDGGCALRAPGSSRAPVPPLLVLALAFLGRACQRGGRVQGLASQLAARR